MRFLSKIKDSFPFLIPLILFLLILNGFFIYQYYQKHPRTPPVRWLDYSNEDFKIKLNYPETFQESKLTEEDKKDRVVFWAEQSNPSALISLRYEEKLGVIKFMRRGSILEILAQNFNNQYPKRFPDFKKEKEESIMVDGVEAKQFYFTYLGKDKSTRIKQRFVIVTRDYEKKELGTVAFYLSFQSKESDFDQVNLDFDKILQSFQFF